MENNPTNPAEVSEEVLKSCKRYGCKKKYKESENVENCCSYHPGKPIFHDRVKGWSCCEKRAYDWEEFELIVGCHQGKHSDVKEELKEGESLFQKSVTVQRAEVALQKTDQEVKVRSIDEYNKELEAKKVEAPKVEESKLTPFLTKNGKYRCVNKGCTKEYDPETQGEEECKHHSGNPIFHDFKKSWSCCKAVAYEFDEFMKLPTCQVGKHAPKMV